MKMSIFWGTQNICLMIHFTELHVQFTCDGKNRILSQASSNPTEKYEQPINHNTNWKNPRKEETHWLLCSSWAKIWPFRNNWYFRNRQIFSETELTTIYFCYLWFENSVLIRASCFYNFWSKIINFIFLFQFIFFITLLL